MAEIRGSLGWFAGLMLCCASASAQEQFGPQPKDAPVTESRGLGRAPAATQSPRVTRTSDLQRGWLSQTTVSLVGVLGLAAGAGIVVRLVSRRQSGLRAGPGAGQPRLRPPRE